MYVALLYVNLVTTAEQSNLAVIRFIMKVFFGSLQLLVLAMALYAYCQTQKRHALKKQKKGGDKATAGSSSSASSASSGNPDDEGGLSSTPRHGFLLWFSSLVSPSLISPFLDFFL